MTLAPAAAFFSRSLKIGSLFSHFLSPYIYIFFHRSICSPLFSRRALFRRSLDLSRRRKVSRTTTLDSLSLSFSSARRYFFRESLLYARPPCLVLPWVYVYIYNIRLSAERLNDALYCVCVRVLVLGWRQMSGCATIYTFKAVLSFVLSFNYMPLFFVRCRLLSL